MGSTSTSARKTRTPSSSSQILRKIITGQALDKGSPPETIEDPVDLGTTSSSFEVSFAGNAGAVSVEIAGDPEEIFDFNGYDDRLKVGDLRRLFKNQPDVTVLIGNALVEAGLSATHTHTDGRGKKEAGKEEERDDRREEGEEGEEGEEEQRYEQLIHDLREHSLLNEES